MINAVDAAKAIASSPDRSVFVLRLAAIFHSPNSLHMVFDNPIVADLNSLLRGRNEDGSLKSSEAVAVCVATCVFAALEYLHGKGLIYRSVHPEGVYVDVNGQAVLGTFRATKVDHDAAQ